MWDDGVGPGRKRPGRVLRNREGVDHPGDAGCEPNPRLDVAEPGAEATVHPHRRRACSAARRAGPRGSRRRAAACPGKPASAPRSRSPRRSRVRAREPVRAPNMVGSYWTAVCVGSPMMATPRLPTTRMDRIVLPTSTASDTSVMSVAQPALIAGIRQLRGDSEPERRTVRPFGEHADLRRKHHVFDRRRCGLPGNREWVPAVPAGGS